MKKMPTKFDMIARTLVMFVGLPASGKTRYYETYFRFKTKAPIRLSLDEFRFEICGREYWSAFEPVVRSWIDVTGRYFMKLHTHDIILDATHLTCGLRKQWITLAKQYRYHVLCVWFRTPASICIKRDSQRTRQVGQEIIKGMAAKLEAPTLKEGFTAIVKIGSDGKIKNRRPFKAPIAL